MWKKLKSIICLLKSATIDFKGLEVQPGDNPPMPFSFRTKELLQDQVAWIKEHDASVTIEGHCDERGTREYNLALGEKRAQSVKNYLISLGVSSNRVSTISYGKERPAVVGSNEAAWGQNRRSVSTVN